MIAGDASTDPATMEELLAALQCTAQSDYSRRTILAAIAVKQSKLNDNFEQRAL
jgi:hypothetical protein